MFTAAFVRSIISAVALATLCRAAPAGGSIQVSASVFPSSVASLSTPIPSSVPVLSAPAITAAPTGLPSASGSPFPSSFASARRSSSELPSTPSDTDSAASASATVPYAPETPNAPMWNSNYNGVPEAIRGSLGATVLGPQDINMVKENPDLLAPPTTDAGSVPNAKWPFSLSHNRLQTGGWARQQNVDVLPVATQMAGVNMRLQVGAVRELHWHKTSEWAYMLKGSVQVTSVNMDGQNFVGTVNAGDLWFFPAGVPHSIQATNDNPDGAEFLLVFDDGSFSEDSTFLLTDWLAHVPKDVLAKNFQTDMSTFNDLPGKELYIFPAPLPGPDSDAPKSPQGTVPSPYTFSMSTMPSTQLSGGSVKIVDSRTFKISTTTAAAEVTVQPGAMRELHWHPTQDEWSYFIEGNARVTLFASQGSARTFDYQAGDVGYVPGTYGHYVENIGNSSLRFLEIFKTDVFQDVSLSQWMALTPPELVKATLNLDDEALKHFSKVKQTVVGPQSSTNSTITPQN